MTKLDLLVLGREGGSPLLLLYGVTLEQERVLALGYTVRYALPDGQLKALAHDNPTDKNWVTHTPGVTVNFPAHDAGHWLHAVIELVRITD